MKKRESCRAIIFNKNMLAVMYREKENRVYYTFPGGGMEENESINECIKREALEELGIIVSPIRELYLYENETTIQHFLLCDWISGEFSTGTGEEFESNNPKGIYIPVFVGNDRIDKIPLMPPIVAKQLSDDIAKFGTSLSDEVKNLFDLSWVIKKKNKNNHTLCMVIFINNYFAFKAISKITLKLFQNLLNLIINK